MNLSLVLCALIISGAQLIGAYKWCCTSKAEFKKCRAFASRVEGGDKVFDFECFLADGTDACMQAIEDGRADLIDIDGGDIFEYQNDITVVAAENVGYEDASYFAIAVVKKGSNPELSMSNIAGYKSCHTGVGKTSGWNMPMGWMVLNGMSPSDIGKSCAPGAGLDKYASLIPGGPDQKWCELCIGDENGDHKCDRDSDERYYGYHGAFQCMKDGVGDVAFIKQTIITAEEAGLYELLCPDAPRRASPINWSTCNLGRVPAHAVVMKKGVSIEDANAVYNNLAQAWNKLPDRNTFSRGKSILWGSKVRFFMYMNRMSARTYMGDDYFCNVWALKYGEKHSSC